MVGCGWQGSRSCEDESAAGTILHRDLDFCLAPNAVPAIPRLVDGAFVGSRS